MKLRDEQAEMDVYQVQLLESNKQMDFAITSDDWGSCEQILLKPTEVKKLRDFLTNWLRERRKG